MSRYGSINAPTLRNPYAGFGRFANQINSMADDHFENKAKNEVRKENNSWKNKVYDQRVATQNENIEYKKERDVVEDSRFEKKFGQAQKNADRTYALAEKKANTPKTLSPEKKEYYQNKADDIKFRQQEKLYKSLMEDPAYSELNEMDQSKAKEYIKKHGKLPSIKYDDSWFGKGHHIADDNKLMQKQLEEDMKLLGL